MKNMKKYLSLTAVLLCFLCSIGLHVWADEPEFYFGNDNGTTVMRGGVSLGEQPYNTDITVSVYDENGDLNFRSVITAGTNGKAEFAYINDGASGTYTCYFAIRSLNLTESVVCDSFLGHEYWDAFISDCNESVSGNQTDALSDLILEHQDLLGLDKELYASLKDSSAVWKLMMADYTAYSSTKDIINAVQGALYTAYINEQQSDAAAKAVWEMEAEGNYLGLRQNMPAGNSAAILDELSAATRDAVFGRIGSKSYATASALAAEYTDQTLLYVIEYAENYGDVQKVLNAYNRAGKIHISNPDPSVAITVYKKMLGQHYGSAAEVEAAFAQYVKDAENASGSRPSGGSTGSTGSSGGSGSGGGRNSGSFSKPSGGAAPAVQTGGGSEAVAGGAIPVPFHDIEDSKWALPAITYWYNEGVISGNGMGEFEPTRNVSRPEMAKMLVEWQKYEPAASVPNFSDMEDGAWYTTYVATAVENGLFNGYEDGSFGVSSGISRQEAACVIYRLLNANGALATKPDEEAAEEKAFAFDDDAQIADWAKEAVYGLYQAGVIQGRSKTTYVPEELMTRAEAVMLLYNAKTYLDK